MLVCEITDVDKLMKIIEMFGEGEPGFIYSKNDNSRDRFIETLKVRYADHEVRVLDARKYKTQDKIKIFDEADYKDDLGGIPQFEGGFFSREGHLDLPRAGESNNKGFLIFTNVNLADDIVIEGIHSLMDIKKLHSYILPEDWIVIAFASELDFYLSNKIITVSLAFKLN